MTHIQSVAKSVTVNNINYLIRVQSYNFFELGSPNLLRLETSIEILEDNWLIVGKFNGFSFNDGIPMIAKLNNERISRNPYHGKEGVRFAEEYLQQLTEAQLVEAMQRTYLTCP